MRALPELSALAAEHQARRKAAVPYRHAAAHEYAAFCAVYGAGVTQSDDYPLFAAARELRMATYAAQHAAAHPKWHAEANTTSAASGVGTARAPWRWIGII